MDDGHDVKFNPSEKKRKSAGATGNDKRVKAHGRVNIIIDKGIEVKDCIQAYLVYHPENVIDEGSMESNLVDKIFIDEYFGEDGKIYGYKDLKIVIWLNALSFHTHVEASWSKRYDGGNGITDLESILGVILGESLVENKEEFLRTFSMQTPLIRFAASDGMFLSSEDNYADKKNGEKDSGVEVLRANINNPSVRKLYERLVPFATLFIEGASEVDLTDPRWDVYFEIDRKHTECGDFRLIGYATVYRFYHYPDNLRFRISQILVLPTYHNHGYGRRLLNAVHNVAKSENIFDVTMEVPSKFLQFVSRYNNTLRLYKFEPIQALIRKTISDLLNKNLSVADLFQFEPPLTTIEDVRRELKINKKEFLRCWEVLLYLNLNSEDPKGRENFKTFLLNRVKSDVSENSNTSDKSIVDVENEYDSYKSFTMFRSPGTKKFGNSNIKVDIDEKEEQDKILETFDKREEDVVIIATKILKLNE